MPPLSTGAGSAIRIPPELMPPDDEAMGYFKTYFDDIHPYVPVLHRSHLYYQWQNDRSSISPLLLEALFACAGRLSDDPAQGAQWLALANSEADVLPLNRRSHMLTSGVLPPYLFFQGMSLVLWMYHV